MRCSRWAIPKRKQCMRSSNSPTPWPTASSRRSRCSPRHNGRSDPLMIETDRLVAAPATPQEEAFERTLRPRVLGEYVGQEKIRGQLAIFIEAARRRKESLD